MLNQLSPSALQFDDGSIFAILHMYVLTGLLNLGLGQLRLQQLELQNALLTPGARALLLLLVLRNEEIKKMSQEAERLVRCS